MSLELKNISKSYGLNKAIDNISFTIKKGEVVGFLGPNGAGKSTTMKILTGFIKPSKGNVFLDNININDNPIEVKKRIGYLSENNPLYLDMYVKEYIEFQANIYRVSKSNIKEVLNKVGLSCQSHKKIKELSKGYRQRVGIASAILHNPQVVILDEPTTGLDPNQLLEIRKLIKELGKEKIVLFSTHILNEIEAVCDRVIIINKGKILINKLLSELKNSNEQVITISFDYKIEEQLIKKLRNIKNIKNNFDNSWTITFSSSEDMRLKLFDFAKDYGLKILELNSKNKTLETVFRELTEKE